MDLSSPRRPIESACAVVQKAGNGTDRTRPSRTTRRPLHRASRITTSAWQRAWRYDFGRRRSAHEDAVQTRSFEATTMRYSTCTAVKYSTAMQGERKGKRGWTRSGGRACLLYRYSTRTGFYARSKAASAAQTSLITAFCQTRVQGVLATIQYSGLSYNVVNCTFNFSKNAMYTGPSPFLQHCGRQSC